MQHSPQEIKTRLDRAVDPDGNVLDMAAVLDVVTILERIPLTREALEKTRIGKTINQLRKKTQNVDLARRAKKLVKIWQRAVVNHIEATRNADSPLNGSRVSSPQFNGSIRDSDSMPGTPTLSEGLEKLKSIEGKKRGVKRKRVGSSSSESSPVVFGKLLDKNSRSRTATPTTEGVDSAVSSPCIITGSVISLPQSQTDICTPKAVVASFANDSEESSSLVCAQNNKENKIKAEKVLEKPEVETSESDNGEVSMQSQSCNEQLSVDVIGCSVLKDKRVEDSCTNDDIKPPMDQVLDVAHCTQSSGENGPELSQCNRELQGLDEDSPESPLPPLPPPKSPSEMELEISAQASGINGRFGADGIWYDWTEVMPCGEGPLNILPYVLLE